MLNHTCCVTGHRGVPIGQIEFVRRRLREELSDAIAQGFTRFLSGYAEGVDQLFAELVIEEMKKNPQIQLEAALPYRERFMRLLFNPKTKPLIQAAGKVTVSCEEYSPGSFHIRNHYMVLESSRVIAVHDGRQAGGTAATLRYAYAKQREVKEIVVKGNGELRIEN